MEVNQVLPLLPAIFCGIVIFFLVILVVGIALLEKFSRRKNV